MHVKMFECLQRVVRKQAKHLMNGKDNTPKTFYKRSVGRQQDFSNCKPQRLPQLCVRNCPLRLFLMKLLKLNIKQLEPDSIIRFPIMIRRLIGWTTKFLLEEKGVFSRGWNINLSLINALDTPLLFPPSVATEPPPPDDVRPWTDRHCRIYRGKYNQLLNSNISVYLCTNMF